MGIVLCESHQPKRFRTSNALTDNVQIGRLKEQWLGVYLAHELAGIVQLNIANVQIERGLRMIRNAHSTVLIVDHFVVQSEHGSLVLVHPGHL